MNIYKWVYPLKAQKDNALTVNMQAPFNSSVLSMDEYCTPYSLFVYCSSLSIVKLIIAGCLSYNE